MTHTFGTISTWHHGTISIWLTHGTISIWPTHLEPFLHDSNICSTSHNSQKWNRFYIICKWLTHLELFLHDIMEPFLHDSHMEPFVYDSHTRIHFYMTHAWNHLYMTHAWNHLYMTHTFGTISTWRTHGTISTWRTHGTISTWLTHGTISTWLTHLEPFLHDSNIWNLFNMSWLIQMELFLHDIICKWLTHFHSMGWLRLVGSLKLQVSFAEYSLFYRALLQKTPVILRSLQIIATPYFSPSLGKDSHIFSPPLPSSMSHVEKRQGRGGEKMCESFTKERGREAENVWVLHK